MGELLVAITPPSLAARSYLSVPRPLSVSLLPQGCTAHSTGESDVMCVCASIHSFVLVMIFTHPQGHYAMATNSTERAIQQFHTALQVHGSCTVCS